MARDMTSEPSWVRRALALAVLNFVGFNAYRIPGIFAPSGMFAWRACDGDACFLDYMWALDRLQKMGSNESATINFTTHYTIDTGYHHKFNSSFFPRIFASAATAHYYPLPAHRMLAQGMQSCLAHEAPSYLARVTGPRELLLQDTALLSLASGLFCDDLLPESEVLCELWILVAPRLSWSVNWRPTPKLYSTQAYRDFLIEYLRSRHPGAAWEVDVLDPLVLEEARMAWFSGRSQSEFASHARREMPHHTLQRGRGETQLVGLKRFLLPQLQRRLGRAANAPPNQVQ